jgi:glycosyltransferase involved in cell wall biosynthesis
MTHIGIDARLTHYRIGGISTYIRQLVLALEPIVTSSHITVFASRKSRERLTSRFAQKPVWTPPHHRLERLALGTELLRHRLDVLHSPDFIPPRWGAKRYVITVHDLTFMHYPQYLTADSRAYYNAQISAAVRQADRILVDSVATCQDLQTMLNVRRDKLIVAQPGVAAQFVPWPAERTQRALAALGLPPAYLLHVGTWEPRKNLVRLLSAYRSLLDTLPDAPPFVMVGRPGWLYEPMMAEINDLKLGEKVIWRDDISDADLPAIYNGAAACVTASVYEGFGLPALESQACGVPALVSNRSSLPEIVGETGLQFDPDSEDDIARALRHAVEQPQWRLQQRPLVLAQAARFNWAQTAAIALNTYESLV